MNTLQNLDQSPQDSTIQLPKVKKRILKSTHKRKLILSAAFECYSNLGLSKTTLIEISKQAKIGSSHILYHFKNTDEIFSELIQEFFKEAQYRSKDYSKKAETHSQKMEAYINAMFDWIYSDRRNSKLFLMFYGECLFHSELKKLRDRTESLGKDYFYYLLKDKSKAELAQRVLTSGLLEYSLDAHKNIETRRSTLNFILSL